MLSMGYVNSNVRRHVDVDHPRRSDDTRLLR
jgi:hypothetical protein